MPSAGSEFGHHRSSLDSNGRSLGRDAVGAFASRASEGMQGFPPGFLNPWGGDQGLHPHSSAGAHQIWQSQSAKQQPLPSWSMLGAPPDPLKCIQLAKIHTPLAVRKRQHMALPRDLA